MTDSRMMRFWGGRNGPAYDETTAGMDGGDPMAGEAQGVPNNEQIRRLLLRRRRRYQGQMGDDLPDFGGAIAGLPQGGVTPIAWGDENGGSGQGGGGGISRLFSMFGGG
jgi:hypothetical protein